MSTRTVNYIPKFILTITTHRLIKKVEGIIKIHTAHQIKSLNPFRSFMLSRLLICRIILNRISENSLACFVHLFVAKTGINVNLLFRDKGITNICVIFHAKKTVNQRKYIDFTKIMCILRKSYKKGKNFVTLS